MVQVAESSKPKRGTKTLDHLEIRPKLGGGHIVRHVYVDYEDKPKDVQFNEDGKGKGGEHILSHLEKHAALPGLEDYGKHGEAETEEESQE